jgi:hypothetical protein
MNQENQTRPVSLKGPLTKLAIIALIVAAVYLLLTDHEAHILRVLPYLLLLACPVLHLLMHGRHGSRGNGGHNH